ncbi:uncharacterized protein [Chelonus insularis]|uniref:uncharacterized protein n=1 Tax=Chelonus insularis TaxID=460826 RepID=UPI00158EF6A1|nr:uncharacterized protein LOC118064536 [Chelonus insularis]
MKVILLLFSIFVVAQCTTYDGDIYSLESKNQSSLLVDASSGYTANDASSIYSITVMQPLFVEPFEVEYEYQDEGGNCLTKGKITSCDANPSTPSGAAMNVALRILASKDASCPLMPGDYKVPDEFRLEGAELGPDALDVETILLCLNMQQVLYGEVYLNKVK